MLDLEDAIKSEINDGMKVWLPFVNIRKIDITKDEDYNTLKIYVSFNIQNAPNMIDSIEVDITGE